MTEDTAARARRPSIYDVALLAGVSHMTVSRVLNDAPHIRPQTRDRVTAAIAELDFRPSLAARTLATQKTRRIGILVDSPTLYGPSSTVLGIEQAARAAGFTLATVSTDGSAREQHAADLESLLTQGVDAVCLIGLREDETASLLTRAGLPTVVVGNGVSSRGVVYVGFDQRGGAQQAVEHLVQAGHRHIAHLAGPPDSSDARLRAAGFAAALENAGGVRSVVINGNWTSDSGFAVGADPAALRGATAVFAANDQMAMGFAHGLWTRSVRVPHEVSIVGFDDIPEARHCIPPLTTVRQDFAELGRTVVREVLALLDQTPSASSIILPVDLVLRESSRAPGPV